MTFRLGALTCLLGLAACSHNSEPARDPSYVHEPLPVTTEPAMTPASLENPNDPHAVNDGSAATDTSPAGRQGTSATNPNGGATPGAGVAPATEAKSPGTQPDNTEVNERDRNSAALTPMDQRNNQTDLDITQRIRQAVMADDSLSFTAKNVKIITQNGKVTLRGPVGTAQERAAIEAAARKVAGAQVDNQIEVKK